ncbi:MAG: hypothetical protein ABF317_00410, partial [Bacteroidia bacterium]
GSKTPFFLAKILDVRHFITQIIEEELSATNCFLVNIKSNESGSDLRFFIDGMQGVGIQTCARLSRKVSRLLDEEYEEETPFRYEISSPGVDQPLLDIRQYNQHIGRELEIELHTEETLKGELLNVAEATIDVEIVLSKKEKEQRTIAFDDIKNSIVIISFKRKKK